MPKLHGTDYYETPEHLIEWAQGVQPYEAGAPASMRAQQQFIADWLAQCVRIANGVRAVVEREQVDDTDM